MKVMNHRLTHLSAAVCAVLFGSMMPAWAEDTKKSNLDTDEPSVVLEESCCG